MLLLHDAGGNRSATVQALPRIIKYFKAKGYEFVTIGNLIGKKKDELMPPVSKAATAYYFWKYVVPECSLWDFNSDYVFIMAIILAMLRSIFCYLAVNRKWQVKKMLCSC